MVTRYSSYSSTGSVIKSDLSELVGYHLLELSGSYVNPDNTEILKTMPGRIAKATRTVCEWICEGQWLDEEGWMADALAAITSEAGDIDHLPWAKNV